MKAPKTEETPDWTALFTNTGAGRRQKSHQETNRGTMQSEMTWHRPRGSLVCLVLALCAASTRATLWEPAANLTSDIDYPRDCSELPLDSPSGVYTLRPALDAVYAYCDMDRNGGGWTVVLRRDDITPRVDFNRDWDTYKSGFGERNGEFYWGNENLWSMTAQPDREYKAHFWLEDFDGNTSHALYQNFAVESEAEHYRLRVGEYSGDAGDSLSVNNYYPFSTFDRDSDDVNSNCAADGEAGWWFQHCTYCQLTGKYYDDGNSGDYHQGITWFTWKRTDPFSLKAAVMKIKPSKKL